MNTTATPDRIDASRAALIVYDACRRALSPADAARLARMRPVLDAWVALIGACRARAMPIIYTTPVSRADGADVVLLPTDLSVETGVPSLTNCVEGTPEAGFPEEIAPQPQDYVYLKRRPSAFYGTGVAELLQVAPPHSAADRRRRDQSRRRDHCARGLQHGPRHRGRPRVLLGRRRRGPRL